MSDTYIRQKIKNTDGISPAAKSYHPESTAKKNRYSSTNLLFIEKKSALRFFSFTLRL
jgi:hypothetical protein